jgi:hypothetical protein
MEAIFEKEGTETIKPSMRCLFMSIEHALKLANMFVEDEDMSFLVAIPCRCFQKLNHVKMHF